MKKEIEVNDIVKVEKRVNGFCPWMEEMDCMIGKNYVVKKVVFHPNKDSSIRLTSENGTSWFFPAESLSLVDNKKEENPLKFRVGQWVKVFRKADDQTEKWAVSMDSWVGEEYAISETDYNPHVPSTLWDKEYLLVGDEDEEYEEYWFPEISLTLAKDQREPKENPKQIDQIKVGDKVKVNRIVRVNYPKWNDKMDEYVGKSGKVFYANDNAVMIEFGDKSYKGWIFPLDSVDLDETPEVEQTLKKSPFPNSLKELKITKSKNTLRGTEMKQNIYKEAIEIFYGLSGVHEMRDMLLEILKTEPSKIVSGVAGNKDVDTQFNFYHQAIRAYERVSDDMVREVLASILGLNPSTIIRAAERLSKVNKNPDAIIDAKIKAMYNGSNFISCIKAYRDFYGYIADASGNKHAVKGLKQAKEYIEKLVGRV